MDQISIESGEREFTFKIEFHDDNADGPPWTRSDGHGAVSDWERRSKRPGELVLVEDRGFKRFYEFQGACKIARREGWNTEPFDIEGETKGQRAARAARADYEYLRQWCNDVWSYVGVVVTLLDDDGNETDVDASLWGVETYKDYHHQVALELANELIGEFGDTWHETTKTTYSRIAA